MRLLHRSVGKVALILSSQWPDKVAKGLMFISLNVDVAPDGLRAEAEAALDRLRVELEGKGVNVADGYWGYRLMLFTISTAMSSIFLTRAMRKRRPPIKHDLQAIVSTSGYFRGGRSEGAPEARSRRGTTTAHAAIPKPRPAPH
jgi:hypothetical protein